VFENVLTKSIIVMSVKVTELTHQPVLVQMVNTLMLITSVKIVTLNV
jgi:hypothetical protein